MQSSVRCIVLAIFLWHTFQASAADKFALLVGVSKYEHAQMNRTLLKYPEADAKAVGELLEKSGYTVVLLQGKQATQKAIEAALIKSKAEGKSEGVVLIGMFGHGVQYGNDAYYGPYDTKLREVRDFNDHVVRDNSGQIKLEPDPASMISMRSILDTLTVCGAESKILLADCCREDPSAARGRAFGSNLQKEGLPRGMAALFACSENEQAFESEAWGHGAFTKALLDECGRASEVTASTLSDAIYRRVRSLVRDKTDGKKSQTVNGIVNGFVDLHIKSPSALNSKSVTPMDSKIRNPRIPLDGIVKNSIEMTFVFVAPQSFLMGASEEDSAASKTEKPQHAVDITEGFLVATHETTQKQYEAVTGQNPSNHRSDTDLPVTNVSWLDAVAFCNQLSVREDLKPYYDISNGAVSIAGGIGYRLPTEAEWELLANSNVGQTRSSVVSVDDLAKYGWTAESSQNESHPVGLLAPNQRGIFDVHGNVWEWCWDRYGKFTAENAVDPRGSTTGSQRVLKGGSYSENTSAARISNRFPVGERLSAANYGFRVVRTY